MHRVVAVLVAAVFLDMLGFGMLIPGVQLRLDDMGAPGWLIGIVQSSTFAVQTIVSPWWGRVGDRVGRKPVFVICTLVSAGSMGVYALANGIAWVAASRVVAGFGGANVAAAQALASLDSGEERLVRLGRIGAALSAGLIAGPALGGLVAKLWGPFWVGLLAFAFSAAGALAAWWLLPQDRPEPKDSAKRPLSTSLLKEVPQLRALMLISAVAWFSLASLEGTFGRLIKLQHGFGEYEFGLLFGFESAIALVVQSVALGPLASRFKEKTILAVGFVAQGAGLALFPLCPSLAALFGASLLYALGSSAANPTLNSRAGSLVAESRHGELFGLMHSARSVGFILGPTVGGVLFDISPGAPYFWAGAVCIAASVLVPHALRQRRTG